MASKESLKIYLTMVIPLTLQNLVTSSVNLLDNLMIGSLGEAELAGVAMANKVFFVYNLMMFGVCSGAIVFFSQFWGKRDECGLRSVMRVGLTLCVALAAVFTLAGTVFPAPLMKLLAGKSTGIIAGGTEYLRISAAGYIFFGLSFILGAGLKSIEQPKVALLGSIVSLLTNGFLNYILIFGKLGLPAFGASGAAIATVTARIFELLVVLIGGRRHWRLFFSKMGSALPKGFLGAYAKSSLPVFFNESLWGLGITVYGAVMARMGTGAAAAHSIVGTVENMLFAVVFGTATAAGVITGREIGAGRRESAIEKARFFHTVSMAQGLVIGIVLFFAAPKISFLFDLTPETRESCIAMLRVCACFMVTKAYQVVAIVGTMRSAGDTLFCMLCDVLSVCLIGVPLVSFTGLALKLTPPAVLAASYVEELVKCIAVKIRLHKGNWIKDLVN